MVLEIEPTFGLSLLALPARRPFAVLQLPELFGKLQPAHGLIDSVSNEDADIAATVVFSIFGKFVEVLRFQLVRSVLHASYQHAVSKLA